MGTTAQKLQRVLDTKEGLKDTINTYLGQDITSVIPFKDYETYIKNFYKGLPKTDYEEGSNITLSNTLKGKLDFEKIYQQVEYIESTGSAYIDTGIIPNTNTKIDIQFETIQRGNFGIIFGGEETYKDNSFHLYNSSGVFDIGFGSMATAFRTSIDYNSSVKYTLIMDKNGFNINGNTGTFPEPTITTTYSIYLFAVHRATNVIESNAQKRIFYCKLYDDGVLIRDMIPCYRKSDGVVGMYDKVQDKFYTNIGTSTFTKGADVGSGFNDIVGYGDTKQEIDLTENNLTSQSANGLTITVNTDKSITINGTASADTKINILNNTIGSTAATERTLEAGTYELTGCPSGSDSGTKFKLDVLRSGYIALLDSGSGDIKTLTSSQTYTYFRIQIFSGTQCNNLVFRPKLLKIPSPSYPQEIEVVRGKNLFNPTLQTSTINGVTCTRNSDNTFTLNGTATAQTLFSLQTMILDTNKTYTLSGTPNGSNNNYFIAGANFTDYGSGSTAKPSRANITFSIVVQNGVTCNNLIFKPMLEKGSQATSYLPYNTVEVKARGKNLADNSKLVNGYMTAEGIWHYGSGNEYRSTDLIEVKEGKTYTSSLYNKNKEMIAYLVWTTYDKNKNFIAQYTTSNIVISSGVKYIRARNYQAQTSYIINDDYLYQVEENNTPTNYEPYVTPQIKQLSLGDIELAKIGNYVDTIEYDVDEDKVYKNKNVNEHTFTENENISLQSINSYGIANFFIPHSLGGVSALALCNYFTLQTSGISVTQEEGFLWQHNGVYFRIKSSTASDVSSFKTWLNSHSVKVEYALAEATKEEITGTLKDQIKAWYNSQSFTGTTIIEIDGQLPLIIKVRALKGE